MKRDYGGVRYKPLTIFSLPVDVERVMQEPELNIMMAAETGDIKAVERILAIHPEWVGTNGRIYNFECWGCCGMLGVYL